MSICSFRWFIFVLIFTDIAYSFCQHFHIALDGDMAAIILPAEWYHRVLEDPFGFSAIFQGEKYGAPNRFFVHWFMGFYFKNIPALLQHFVSPIDSVYLACALLKTAIQVLIGWMLAAYISETANLSRREFLLAAVLILPLFQNADYRGTMGVIEGSITYTCFYALPMGLLLLFFFPFFRAIRSGSDLQLSFLQKIMLACLAVVLAFNGPLVPPVVLITCLLILFYFGFQYFRKNGEPSSPLSWIAYAGNMPKQLLAYLLIFSILCLYSLWLGTYNVENDAATVPVLERYTRLPLGMFNQFSLRLGLPLLLALVLVNAVFLKKLKNEEAARMLKILKWVGLFCLLFILLLPLGGYRDYRPNIIRRDTLLPVLLCLMFCFGLTSSFLLRELPQRFRKFFAGGIVFVLVFYTAADVNPRLFDHNRCQRAALEQLATSPEKVVHLSTDCTVLTWTPVTNERDSELYGRLLLHWGVTKEMKYFYQK